MESFILEFIDLLSVIKKECYKFFLSVIKKCLLISKFASFVQQFNRISGRPDIWQMKLDIWLDTGYPLQPYCLKFLNKLFRYK